MYDFLFISKFIFKDQLRPQGSHDTFQTTLIHLELTLPQMLRNERLILHRALVYYVFQMLTKHIDDYAGKIKIIQKRHYKSWGNMG